jgi:acylaminoacyl-peptidase
LGVQTSFSPEDWWAWREIEKPRISADGTRVVFAECWADRAANARRCNLWTVAASGGERRALTGGAWRDWAPRWSPDGSSVAYFSDRSGNTQIFVSGAANGTARQVTHIEGVPLAYAWSPDGGWLAFTVRVDVSPSAAIWAPREILPWLRQGPASRVELFVVAATGGAARTLGLGNLDAIGEPAWMPDGQSLLIAAAPPADAMRALEGGEIYDVRLRDGLLRQITDRAGFVESMAPSPDGSRIAWVARAGKPQSYVVAKLHVASSDGSREKALAGGLDRDVSAPQWSADSRTVYFLADDRGSTHVYAARNDGSTRQVTTGVERLSGFALADNGRAVAVRSSAKISAELVAFAVDLPGKAVKLAAVNEGLLAEREWAAAEEVQYVSGGKTIQAWIVKPPGFDPKRKYPLLLDVEDDPRRMCGAEFRLRAQVFAARGMVVLCANPRGTPGYGEEFGNLIHSRYPGDDFDDLMAGVDAIAAKGFIDTGRIGIAGGLLAAWAIGHTGRFHSAVTRDPIADWVAEAASAPDGLYRAAAWMGAMPWDDPAQYSQHSPIYFAGSFRTPTLVIARGNNPGAEELYFALQARRADSAFVRLPEAARPSQTVLEWETTLAWLSR